PARRCADPSSWPLNRRVLYNRASADINGKPWDAKRMLIQWNGSKWVGNDIPDFNTAPPGSNTGPFIMQQEGLGRLFALRQRLQFARSANFVLS
ncbi:hypothetical protein FK513_31785, partial [Klebsiella pneumoniae]|uniref:hypothetical protein n=1 Tax=Klebsiella pneumoniae TaxID=573 RepID=UPI002108B4B9